MYNEQIQKAWDEGHDKGFWKGVEQEVWLINKLWRKLYWWERLYLVFIRRGDDLSEKLSKYGTKLPYEVTNPKQ